MLLVRSGFLKFVWLCCLTGMLILAWPCSGQTTVGTGSIVGTVADPSGAVVAGAKVKITNVGTGQVIDLTTNSSGVYNSGALIPGGYKVLVQGKGFRSSEVTLTVQVGNTASGNVRLQLGAESQVVEVQGSTVAVNTDQATVQGVLSAEQIENLPINGRNFLDLAQLEPGVQIQDGQDFDPTKAGFSSISFGGRAGRTARIEVDGVDVSDETVGTTTTDIPSSAIEEFQLSQSSLDLSSELTSSGAVNVTTKSGTNTIHGEAFGGFRDSSLAAALPTPPGFSPTSQRSQYGGRVGGPILKDKLFYFLDGERTLQHEQAPILVGDPFSQYSGVFSSPFVEDNLLGKADYQLSKAVHVFYRFSYFKNALLANGGAGFSVYDNKNITRTHLVGADFNTGSFTHSFRFSYLKFQNQIVDATLGTSLPLANLGVELQLGSTNLYTGPNYLAPQTTLQSNHQFKYDGGKTLGAHIIRYGFDYNHIVGGGFADFNKIEPFVVTDENSSDAGLGSNPLNYPVEYVYLGNGLGYSSSTPAFGYPAGGITDNRIGLYVGDSWKLRKNLTVSYGLRYVRDSNRSDSYLPAIPQLSAAIPGLGNQVAQPNLNFAPQLGVAWDPKGNGKTAIRAGIGLFYENAIWNNVAFDAPGRQATGAFGQFPTACNDNGTTASPVYYTNPQTNQQEQLPLATFCGATLGSAVSAMVAYQQLYQSLSPFNKNAPNPNYSGAIVPQGGGIGLTASMFDPNYKSPRSVQMNFGVQHEIRPGLVFSADFVRNVQTHYLLGIDENETGDIRHFNLQNGLAAISATNGSFGCGSGTDLSTTQCAINHGAVMSSYAGNGLTSSSDFDAACGPLALGVGLPYPCAFGGINPNYAPLPFLKGIGRSVYNGLQAKLIENVKNPVRGVRALNVQVSYSLSRFENSGGSSATSPLSSDQDFINNAADNTHPNRFFGPSVLDRTHQISFGGYADIPAGFQISLIGHFWSPLSTTLVVPNTGLGPGEIFRTDFTGDGSVQDPLPGTHIGNFDRGINAASINKVIANYDNTVAGQATPAGQVLIQNGLFTLPQLQQMGDGVAPYVCQAPPVVDNPLLCSPPSGPGNEVNLAWLRAMDMKFSWRHTFHERVTVEPSAGFFNLFNFSNFDLPGGALSGLLTGGAGNINGTVPGPAGHDITRVGVGTGVYALGAPRQLEFGLQVSF